jgi:hypothetical protein
MLCYKIESIPQSRKKQGNEEEERKRLIRIKEVKDHYSARFTDHFKAISLSQK